MLPRPNRLTKTSDFDRVWKKGRAFFVAALGIKALRSSNQFSRFGFIAATTVSKRAVDRNRIKRRFRGAVQRHFQEINPGFDIIIMARPPIMDLTRKETETVLLSVLRRAGVLQ